MDLDFINCFITSTTEVLGDFISFTSLEKGKITKESINKSTQEVTIKFNIVGNIEGMALFCCDKETAISIVQNMTGEKFDQINDYVMDAISELGNIITGRTSNLLDSKGYSFRLSPPELIHNVGSGICKEETEFINIPIITQLGTLNIKIDLQITSRAKYKSEINPQDNKILGIVMLCDHTKFLTEKCSPILKQVGFTAVPVPDSSKILDTFKNTNPDLVFFNISMSNKIITIIDEMLFMKGNVIVVTLGSIKEKNILISTLEAGARVYLEIPTIADEILFTAKKYLTMH